MGRDGLLLWYSLEDNHGAKEDEWMPNTYSSITCMFIKGRIKKLTFILIRYAAPQLLRIMQMEWDTLAAATFRANRK
eukprot:2173008-Ditylum_brightwellii.AAC.1